MSRVGMWFGSHWKATCLVMFLALASVSAVYAYWNIFGVQSSSTKTFVYEWPYGDYLMNGQQLIANRTTLRLEITFESGNDTVNIVAKINDDDYYDGDMLGLVFDRSGNGFIDIGEVDLPYILLSSNKTWDEDVLLEKDYIITYLGCHIPRYSPYHTCTFKEGVGYTFNIHFPKSEIYKRGSANMVYVYFWDQNVQAPVTEYHYVSVMIEGWQ